MRCFFSSILVLILIGCASAPLPLKKMNGVSFVASRDTISQQHVQPVVQLNANYAAIMPFGFIKELEHPEIIHNTERQWYGETRSGAKQYIETLKSEGIKIMIKPQIWVWRGEFTGLIKMNTEEDWKTLETSYTDFILEYAALAEETNSELFCIGTELENFIAARPEFWKGLITKVREIYNGKLTYASNWDEYKRTPFWKEIDYIGIDAYFPLSDKQAPTVKDYIEGWSKHKPQIEAWSKQLNKPILFTEYGYRSMDYAGREPWLSDHKIKTLNLEAQANATEALFEVFWHEPWFAGGFVWKWFHNYENSGGQGDNQFTPQNKPAEEVIRTYYKTYK